MSMSSTSDLELVELRDGTLVLMVVDRSYHFQILPTQTTLM
jgi:hypothetical protein